MMDHEFAQTHNLLTSESSEHSVTGWDNEHKKHIFHLSKPFNIISNGSSFYTRCYIKHKLGHPIAFGTDLLPQLGISIHGLSYSPNAPNKKSPPTPLDSQTRPITFINTNSLNSEQLSAFMNAIQPALDRNAGIPTSEKCTLPYAVINIDLKPDAKPVYRKQYTIPQSREYLFDEQIKKWDEGNVTHIVQGPSPWNSPLTAAPKRDFNDLLLETRICIDPRHINELTKPIVRQSRSAKSILHTVTNSEFFSKIDLVGAYNQLPFHPNSQKITSFIWKGIRREFIGAMWGFKNIGISLNCKKSRLCILNSKTNLIQAYNSKWLWIVY